MASDERMRALALLSEPSTTLQIEADEASEATLSQSVIGSRWNNRFLWVALGFAALLSVVVCVALPDGKPGSAKYPHSVSVLAFNPVLPVLPVVSAGGLLGMRPRAVSINPPSKLVLPPVYSFDRPSKRVPLRTAARLGGSVDGSGTELENGITITQGEIAKGQMADIKSTAELLSHNFFDYGVDLNNFLGKQQRCTLEGMFTEMLQSTVKSYTHHKPQCTLLLAKQREELVGAALVHTQMFNEVTHEFRPREFHVPPWDMDKFIPVPVLSNMVVRKDKRGLGLGADLLAAAQKEVRAWKYPKLFVFVKADNAPSRNLFESRGFTRLCEKGDLSFLVPGRRSVQLKKVKLLLMSKTLSDEPGSTSSGQHHTLANLEVDKELAINQATVWITFAPF